MGPLKAGALLDRSRLYHSAIVAHSSCRRSVSSACSSCCCRTRSCFVRPKPIGISKRRTPWVAGSMRPEPTSGTFTGCSSPRCLSQSGTVASPIGTASSAAQSNTERARGSAGSWTVKTNCSFHFAETPRFKKLLRWNSSPRQRVMNVSPRLNSFPVELYPDTMVTLSCIPVGSVWSVTGACCAAGVSAPQPRDVSRTVRVVFDVCHTPISSCIISARWA
mmetsp:Transcript_81902/g.144603  ORF Transcript_81902/g.144603 Transcript_81902/m.144603 type:complete len:220 (+) Transcript_81902:1897-2556(+)